MKPARSEDLYGDEALFDELLSMSLDNQKCERCGDYIVDEDGEPPRRFRKLCLDCRPARREPAKKPKKRAQRKSRATIALPVSLFTAPHETPPRTGVDKDALRSRIGKLIADKRASENKAITWDELYAMIGIAP